jgi:uncharacterized membrane protein YdcZ (DUF606 family)
MRALKRHLLFLIGGLLVAIPVTSTVFAVSPIGHVDLPVILLLF